MNHVPTIAIVDDDEQVRTAAGSLVRSLGWRAATYASPSEMLRSPILDSVDCLITDLQMPEMTGLDLHDQLRRRGIDLPTIVITAFPDDDYRRRAREAGVIDFLDKPFDSQALLDRINEALGLAPDPR